VPQHKLEWQRFHGIVSTCAIKMTVASVCECTTRYRTTVLALHAVHPVHLMNGQIKLDDVTTERETWSTPQSSFGNATWALTSVPEAENVVPPSTLLKNAAFLPSEDDPGVPLTATSTPRSVRTASGGLWLPWHRIA